MASPHNSTANKITPQKSYMSLSIRTNHKNSYEFELIHSATTYCMEINNKLSLAKNLLNIGNNCFSQNYQLMAEWITLDFIRFI